MNVFIIGAGSFLGENLSKMYAQKGANVVASESVSIVQAEWGAKWREVWLERIMRGLRVTRPDIVFIAGAAQRSDDGLAALEEMTFCNIVMPGAVANEILNSNEDAKLVAFGTAWQTADSDKYRPFNLYAATKQASEDVLMHYCLKGLKIASVRLFDTYGDRDHRRKLLNILVEASQTGDEIDTTPGAQEIDLIHMDDVCSGVDLIVQELGQLEPTSGLAVYGLGSAKPITVRELIRRIGARKRRPIRARIGKRRYRDREVMSTWKEFRSPSGWTIIRREFHSD